MPRASKSQPFDTEIAAAQLVELGVQRRQFIKARIRVLNAAGALVRRALGWQPSLDEGDSAKIAKQAAKIMSAENADELPEELTSIAKALTVEIATAKKMAEPAEIYQHQVELLMRKTARRFPVWEAWAKDVRGLSDLGLAIIIAEAGQLDKYPTHSKLWRRLGLAPFTKNGETRSCSMWRMKGGLSSDDWTEVGYSPRRRASIFSQVGGSIIGGMGKGYRPLVGEDIEQNTKLSHYEKVFVHRLRYEAARDETMKRPDTKEGRESYSKVCAAKAQFYTEKRLLRDLWKAWRRATVALTEKSRKHVPATEIADAPQGAGEANRLALPQASNILPPHQFTDAA